MLVSTPPPCHRWNDKHGTITYKRTSGRGTDTVAFFPKAKLQHTSNLMVQEFTYQRLHTCVLGWWRGWRWKAF